MQTKLGALLHLIGVRSNTYSKQVKKKKQWNKRQKLPRPMRMNEKGYSNLEQMFQDLYTLRIE